MTDIAQLFSGIGVVIDEAIFASEDGPNGIQKIIHSFESRHIPLLKFKELPDNELIPQLHSISFLLLDWNLSGIQPIPKATVDDNIEFIKKIREICYVPVFIFSDEDSHTIEISLSEHEITPQNSPIFIRKKEDLDTVDKLFDEIEKWIKKTPSVYVLKEWEKSTRDAKIMMLSELSSIHASWPFVLVESVQEDGGDSSWELMNSLQNNLSHRIIAPKFDNEVIEAQKEGISKEEVRKILECERFIPNNKLPDYPFAGDIYIINDNYYVNIRPDCDIIREKKDLYLLKGTIIDETTINSEQDNATVFKNGEFLEKINNCYVAFVDGKILSFSMRKLTIEKWNDIKANRQGRLLPPFITKIQQKYSSYIQRQGLPSIPGQAIN
ncbi:MAG: hypothetical protein SPL12_07510 [Bacteroidales bacterium]|nr:hypothetical protein [Bacteroidales bacterium]